MKKPLAALVMGASLLYLLSSCSGHFVNTPSPTQYIPTPAEQLLTLSAWQTQETDSAELVFNPDFSGTYEAMPFSWCEEDGAVTLHFFPDCCVGAEYALALDADNGRTLKLSGAIGSFTPALLSAPENSRSEPEVSEEELLGQQIADFAVGFIGYNYKYGGKSPETGFDCSGLVYYVYEQFGYHLERVAAEQAKQGVEVAHDALMPGDLLAFHTSGSYVGHIGIYVGNGYYVHAMGSAYGVVLTSLDAEYSQREYDARRIIGNMDCGDEKYVLK